MIKGSCLCGGVRFEIAAGVLDDGPQIRPERHIMCRREVAVVPDLRQFAAAGPRRIDASSRGDRVTSVLGWLQTGRNR